jgi:hypothetical protein
MSNQLIKGLGSGDVQWEDPFRLTAPDQITDLFRIDLDGTVHSNSIRGPLYILSTPASTGAGTSAQTLVSYTLPGSTLSSGKCLEVTAFGHTASNTNSKHLVVSLGGVTLVDNGSSDQWNNEDWYFSGKLVVGASNNQHFGLEGTVGGGSTDFAIVTDLTLDMTADQLFEIVCTDGSDSAGDLTVSGVAIKIY